MLIHCITSDRTGLRDGPDKQCILSISQPRRKTASQPMTEENCSTVQEYQCDRQSAQPAPDSYGVPQVSLNVIICPYSN